MGDDLEARLARAEERLAFFASFDRLIQDNVSQAGQLMRDALELRERTQSELDLARTQAEARVAAERGRFQDDLGAIHTELVALQATVAAMARRVAATLGALAAADLVFGGPGSAATPVTAVGAGAEAAELADGGAEPGTDAIEISVGGAEVGDPDEALIAVPDEELAVSAGVDVDRQVAVETGPDEEGGPGTGTAGFPVEGIGESVAEGAETGVDGGVASGLAVGQVASRAVTVLVHGVPRAAAALSLQRHLHGLRQVESVEAREYAEGVLRLQVVTDEALGLDDLRGWDGGGGLEPVTVTAEVIEVRLPGAHGF